VDPEHHLHHQHLLGLLGRLDLLDLLDLVDPEHHLHHQHLLGLLGLLHLLDLVRHLRHQYLLDLENLLDLEDRLHHQSLSKAFHYKNKNLKFHSFDKSSIPKLVIQLHLAELLSSLELVFLLWLIQSLMPKKHLVCWY
jgi:hypothetical protein